MVPDAQYNACPICRGSAVGTQIDDPPVALFECEQCSTFTITTERMAVFANAWQRNDRETLMYVEAISAYLRHAGDDDERHISDETWIKFAVEGQDFNNDDEPNE
jgi:hypothetical protein